MVKKKQKEDGLYSTKDKFFIIVIGILLLLVVYLFGKNNSLFLGSTKNNPIPTTSIPTVTPAPTDTPMPQKIYYAPLPTNQPTATSVPQRVPVIGYYGQAIYCDPSAIDVIKQAVQSTQLAETSSNSCEDSARSAWNSCESICANTNQGQSCYDNCTSVENSGKFACNVEFTNALNTYLSLAKQYCN